MVSSKKEQNEDTILQVETKSNSDVEAEKSNNSNGTKKSTRHVIEVEYWHVLPSIRREIASYLKDEKKLKQKEIASILGITEAGVSQYLKGTRGVLKVDDTILEVPKWIKKEVEISCERFVENLSDSNLFLKEVNRILSLIRDRPKDFLCMIHNEFGYAEDDCDICLAN